MMAEKRFVSREGFLRALVIEEQELEIQGLGTVRFRPLSLEERQSLSEANTRNGKQDTAAMMAATIVKGLVEPKLSDADVAAIRKGNPAVIDSLAMAIASYSGTDGAFEGEAGSGS